MEPTPHVQFIGSLVRRVLLAAIRLNNILDLDPKHTKSKSMCGGPVSGTRQHFARVEKNEFIQIKEFATSYVQLDRTPVRLSAGKVPDGNKLNLRGN